MNISLNIKKKTKLEEKKITFSYKKKGKDFDIWQENLYRWQNTIRRHTKKKHMWQIKRWMFLRFKRIKLMFCRVYMIIIIIFGFLNLIFSDIINVKSKRFYLLICIMDKKKINGGVHRYNLWIKRVFFFVFLTFIYCIKK